MKKLILLFMVTVVLASDADAGVRAGVHVRIGAPPAVRREVIVARPYRHAVWVPGYWAYSEPINEYVWVPGSWQRPPRRRAVWVAPTYRKGPQGYIYVGGYWR